MVYDNYAPYYCIFFSRRPTLHSLSARSQAQFHASERSVPPDGNYYVFRKFFEVLNTLQIEGITLNLEDRSEKVYFCVGLFLADNLGFHNAMGFAGGLNSNYYCRFCKVCKEVMRLQFKEKRGELRKLRDYCEDVGLGLQLSGIVENSVWNSLLNFHVYENYAADILHDLFRASAKPT